MRTPGRRARLAAVAMAAAVVAAGCSDSDPPGAASAPTISVTASAPTSAPTSPSTTRPGRSLTFTAGLTTVPAPGPRPVRLLAITEGGVLVVVDATTGAQEEVTRQADPRLPHTGEGPRPNSLRGVSQSLDGRTAYFTVGPEPACGNVSEVAVAGGTPESRGDGEYVTPGPRGYYATSGGCSLSIRRAGEVLGSVATPNESFLGRVAWSPDGRYLAVERYASGTAPLIMVLDLLEADPWASASELSGREGIGYGLPAFRNDGRLVVVERVEDGPATALVVDPADGALVTTFSYGDGIVDQAYDATHTWLLVTMADGRLRWFGGGDQGDLGTGYIAADW